MAILNVNSTRMELNNLKRKLKTAKNGHKLLKNKKDGLVSELSKLVKTYQSFREDVCKNLKKAALTLELAKAESSRQAVKIAILNCEQNLKVSVSKSNVMGTDIPVFSNNAKNVKAESYHLKFSQNSAHFEEAVKIHKEVLINLIDLASKEKTILILANEIEKTKRKVNALEYFIIPSYEQTMRAISLKLEENERNNLARLINLT